MKDRVAAALLAARVQAFPARPIRLLCPFPPGGAFDIASRAIIHMSLEMFKQLTKTDIVHVPYKGSAPAVTDLLGGQVQLMFDNIPSALPHIRAGTLRALATTGARRDPALPDLPTIAEAGVPGYDSGVWFGLAAPAGTSREVVQRIAAEAIKGSQSPDFVKRMTELGYVIIGAGPDQMAEMLRGEVARWGPVVKASGATAD